MPTSSKADSSQLGLTLAFSRERVWLSCDSWHERKRGSDMGSGAFVNPGPLSTLSIQSFERLHLCLYPGHHVAIQEMEHCGCWRMAEAKTESTGVQQLGL